MSMPAEALTTTTTLRELLAGICDAPALEISGISADSRTTHAGDVFLACQGATSHGLDYLDQAIAAGVAAVLWDASTAQRPDVDVPLVAIDHLSHRIGEIANRWYDNPSRDLRVAGVTGTNGKTTVAYLTQQCLNLLERKCGYIGTLGNGIDEIAAEDSMTTPPCIELHEKFADFRAAGADFAAIEVSSHALQQRRVDGVRFAAALFTNLSRDHIDYHGDMRRYFETKASLFLDCDVEYRIINVDSDFGVELASACGADAIWVSTRPDLKSDGRPFLCVRSVSASDAGSDIAVSTSWGDGEFSLPLPGEFNVANATQVLAFLLCQGVSLDDACKVFPSVIAPPGRMQIIRMSTHESLPTVFVDYSHTPASLEVALTALRSHCKKNLWCVFGCGGDRDRGKRPMMGEIADRLADVSVLTNDNPRTESPAQIIADIRNGMRRETESKTRAIEDRGAAIAYAVANASSDDVVLIAGKGHEDYQIVGTNTQHFSDYEVAASELVVRAGRNAERT